LVQLRRPVKGAVIISLRDSRQNKLGVDVMADEVLNEEERIRTWLVKMDDAFCAAMFKAIEAGDERAPTAICTEPSTRTPIVVH
jgi:hypothetical protein